jgi:hypothetical protein
VRFFFGVSLVVLGALAAPSAAQQARENSSQAAAEHEVKAAFLFKFLPFIEWPAGAFDGPEAPIVIGILGSPEIAADLEALAEGRPLHGRGVEVSRIDPQEATEGLHVLFIGRSEERRLPEIARALRGRPVLIVSEAQDALDQGSMVNFVVAGGRVRFEVSLDAAAQAKLRISARMLSVAINVRPARP